MVLPATNDTAYRRSVQAMRRAGNMPKEMGDNPSLGCRSQDACAVGLLGRRCSMREGMG
jgi:hypothetical protein